MVFPGGGGGPYDRGTPVSRPSGQGTTKNLMQTLTRKARVWPRLSCMCHIRSAADFALRVRSQACTGDSRTQPLRPYEMIQYQDTVRSPLGSRLRLDTRCRHRVLVLNNCRNVAVSKQGAKLVIPAFLSGTST